MKIGILTQPLRNNYGGLLQAYALKKVLEDSGNEVWILQRDAPQWYDDKRRFVITQIKRAIKVILGKPTGLTLNELKLISSETEKFVNKYFLNKSPRLLSTIKLKEYVEENGFDAIVVGSDQVWRPIYNADIRNNFLDFCEGDTTITRVAYAASFGVDTWEFSEEQTETCRRLAPLFDAISVREDSGVELCRKYLGVSATHVLDPTLLLEKDDYVKLVQEWGEQQSQGDLFCYILDSDDKKTSFIDAVKRKTGLAPFNVYPRLKRTPENVRKYPESCVYPRVTQWLRAFNDAEMVITDSFHGCVFSIIFNIPFWCIGNPERGNARFDSLLKLFHLEDRLVGTNAQDMDFNAPIDWTSVNEIRKEMIVKSMKVFKILHS